MITRACLTSVTLFLIAAIAVAPGGCTSTPPPTLADELEISDDKTRVLATQLDEYFYIFGSAVEQALEDVHTDAPNSPVRRRALLTMLRANEEAARARFHTDPVAALADMWTLTGQMRNFFETGEGRDWFPDLDPPLTDTLRKLDLGITRIGCTYLDRPFDPNVDPADQRPPLVASVINENSMKGRVMLRVSADVEIEELRAEDQPRDVFGSLESIDTGVARIPKRLDSMTWMLPRFISLYAGLLIEHRLAAFERSGYPQRINAALAALAELPGLIAGERTTIMDGLASLRTDVMDEVDRQRVETLAHAEDIGLAIMTDVDWQREESLARLDDAVDRAIGAVSVQTGALLDRAEGAVDETVQAIDDQRQLTLEGIETLEATVAQDAALAMEKVVDRLFWRLATLLGIGLLGGAGLVLLMHKLHRSRLLEAAMAGRAS